jgi:hypothetical protein
MSMLSICYWNAKQKQERVEFQAYLSKTKMEGSLKNQKNEVKFWEIISGNEKKHSISQYKSNSLLVYINKPR